MSIPMAGGIPLLPPAKLHKPEENVLHNMQVKSLAGRFAETKFYLHRQVYL